MRKVFLVLVGLSVLGVSSTLGRAAQRQQSQVQFVKTRQKQERKQLKLKQRYEKASYRGQRVPKGVRDQRKHAMQRERRALRDKQRAELQDVRDQQKVYKESLRR